MISTPEGVFLFWYNVISMESASRNKIKRTSFWGLALNYFKPSIYISHFSKVEPVLLKKQGIKVFICDLDNTLVPHYNKFPNKEVIDFITSVQDEGIKFILVSNNTNKRVKFFSEKTNVDGFYGNAKKPFPGVIKKIIKDNNVKNSEVIIMGDMLITDILVANFAKIESILVQPIIGDSAG
jgi:HAD superfamily phosphatase (TIGR01668 family)